MDGGAISSLRTRLAIDEHPALVGAISRICWRSAFTAAGAGQHRSHVELALEFEVFRATAVLPPRSSHNQRAIQRERLFQKVVRASLVAFTAVSMVRADDHHLRRISTAT